MYFSPLRIDENYPSFTQYCCSKTGDNVGMVYKDGKGHWWLLSTYLQWKPKEVFAKYLGFLTLNELHKHYYEINN